jgi:hypothetical protein
MKEMRSTINRLKKENILLKSKKTVDNTDSSGKMTCFHQLKQCFCISENNDSSENMGLNNSMNQHQNDEPN